jgi:apolipoprotein N-acyltransferase
MQKTLRYYSLPSLAGILIGTSYIPFPPWALLFCIVPLWIFWYHESSYKKVFIAGWLTQFILNAIGFHWIAHTTVEFGQMPWPAGLAVLLLFCTLAHLYYPISGLIWKYLCNRFKLSPKTSIVLLPFVFILCERLYPFIFYWHFGYPWLWARWPGYQVAEWIGFFGLNLITLIINSFFVLFLVTRQKNQWFNKTLLIPLGIFLITNVLGFIISKNIKTPDQSLKVSIIQGNIGNLEKIQAQEGHAYLDKIVDTYINLSQEAIKEDQDIDLIIWPETAFPEIIDKSRFGMQRRKLSYFSQENHVPIFTGVYESKAETKKIYNSFALFDGYNLIDSYQKTHLLAFGEYFPFGEIFPRIKALFPMVSDFGRGPGPSVIKYKNINFGPQICYEGLFDEFSTRQQKKSAQIFINVTNDSWFGYPFEPNQHMFMTLARAIENRTPLVRSTNTGISTVILHNGKILDFSPHNKEWYKTYEIPYYSQPVKTFYANLAELWPWILISIIVLIILGDRFARTIKH